MLLITLAWAAPCAGPAASFAHFPCVAIVDAAAWNEAEECDETYNYAGDEPGIGAFPFGSLDC